MKVKEAKIKYEGREETIKLGDLAGFKADMEQAGEITKIELVSDSWTGRESYEVEITNENGFIGEYIGGQTTYKLNTEREMIWIYRR